MSALELVPALDQTLLALQSRPWQYVLIGPRRKYPVTEHWTVTRDEARLVEHVTDGGNLGLVCHEQTGIAVLDCDHVDLWREMVDELGEPGKPWVRTGSGKFHCYVAWQRGLPAKLVWNEVKVGEIQRGPGQQQVVVPPSLHPDTGQRYEWLVDPATQKLKPLPPLWHAYLYEPEVYEPEHDARRNGPSPDVQRYLDAALRQPGAKRRGSGVKFQCAGCLAEGHDHHRDNAVVWASGRWGCAVGGRAHNAAIARQLGVTSAGTDATPTPTLAILGMGAFIATIFSESEPYIDGILSDDGGGWLGGEEKTGKTWWMEAEATSLALAKPLAGRFAVPQRRRALILEEEDSPRRTHRRVRAVLRGHGVDPDDPAVQTELDAWLRISVWSGFTLDNPLLVAQLETAIKDFRPAVVYIDCLRKVTLKDLNKAAEAGTLLAILDDLRRRYNVVFRLVHHFRKQQGFRTGRGSQEIGGSFVLGAWGENSLFFEPIGRKQGAVRVEVQTKDAAPVPGFTLKLESEGLSHNPTLVRLVAEEDVDLHASDEVVYQAVATLPKQAAKDGDSGVSKQALISALKLSESTVRRALKHLIDDERCLVTGTMNRQTKLYGVNA